MNTGVGLRRDAFETEERNAFSGDAFSGEERNWCFNRLSLLRVIYY